MFSLKWVLGRLPQHLDSNYLRRGVGGSLDEKVFFRNGEYISCVNLTEATASDIKSGVRVLTQ
jgi:hypothetical protein